MSLSPPTFATSLLELLIVSSDRAELLGDLQEEFANISLRSPAAARSWYWRQAALSAPYFLLKRFQSSHVKKITVALVAAVVTYLFIKYWDVFLARAAVRGLASNTDGWSVSVLRSFYLLVQMLGVAIGGGAIAALTFEKQRSFIKNALARLAPISLLIFAPKLYALIDPTSTYPTSYKLIWIMLAVPSLVLGALCMMWFLTRQQD